ncbi:YciI family protein [Pontibacter sp. G13]|uniref:YciI family protein n=1 Tax=Pontibacter sp. G13 TaxID=3074898 RepID=UPI00288A65CE|nr:YciI family protein [Pontibacter sp. G13]WNJ21011.1 YciI family protein [Pontibacter sp. G13]
MKYLLTFYLSATVGFLLAQESRPISMQNMSGNWEAESISVSVDGAQGVSVKTIEANKTDFLQVLGIKTNAGDYHSDSTYTEYYLGEGDSLLAKIEGRWYVSQDSMYAYPEGAPEKANAFRVRWLDEERAEFSGLVDWDNDGQQDDRFVGISRRISEEMQTYYMVMLKAAPARDTIPDQKLAQIQSEHLAHIRNLAREGKLSVAGPFLDEGEIRGIFILNVDSMEEARAITEADPAVKAGRLIMEIRPWYGPSRLKID